MKFKLIIIIILSILIGTNLYFSQKHPDKYTQAKANFSSLVGSTSYLGRLDFWHLLVQNGDWSNAATIENKLNPMLVAQKITEHEDKKSFEGELFDLTKEGWDAFDQLKTQLKENQ